MNDMNDTVEAKYVAPKHEGQLMEKEDGRWKMYYFELRDGMLYKFPSSVLSSFTVRFA